MIYWLPELKAIAKDGKLKFWRVGTDGGEMTVEHWKDGGKRTQAVRQAKPKNVGRANETSADEQAVLEAQSKQQKQMDKGYTEGTPEVPMLPMLAHKFTDHKHKINYPALVQRKLDGVRCMAFKVDGEIVLKSRGGKIHPADMNHIKGELTRTMKEGQILDGELFTTELTFQEIISAVKKQKEITDKLEYWVYDIIDDSSTFQDRCDTYQNMGLSHPVIAVETIEANSEKDVRTLHDQFVQEGYEGAMARNSDSSYKIGYRSYDLLKVKVFDDDEFEIIGGKQATGEDSGTVVFQCTCDAGEFDVRPRGSREQRSEWFDNIDNLIGSQLTVRYQGFSDRGIPRFPVGVGIRDDGQ